MAIFCKRLADDFLQFGGDLKEEVADAFFRDATYGYSTLPTNDHGNSAASTAVAASTIRRWVGRCPLAIYSGIVMAIAVLFMAAIPLVQIGVIHPLVYSNAKPVIDDKFKDSCSCNCWDTVSKGSYFNYPANETSHRNYFHWYVNATKESFEMWVMIVIYVVLVYETMKFFLWTFFRNPYGGRKRYLFCYFVTFYSHYYTFWMYMGYLNEDWYEQWYHQLYFTITEVCSTIGLLTLLDRRRPVRPCALYVVLAVSIGHVILGSRDQFFADFVDGVVTSPHLRVRNSFLLVPDLILIGMAVAGIIEANYSIAQADVKRRNLRIGVIASVLLPILGWVNMIPGI